MLGFQPQARTAYYTAFKDSRSETLDKGIALFFQGPHSFTGEDVLELQGHGGTFVLNSILKATLELGCRLARPGEFSERAFLNGKLDLIQAEAIADLINASTEHAARSAFRSLEGAFSRRINELVDGITELRVFLEAAIDFTDEDIDFISDGRIAEKLATLEASTAAVLRQAHQGSLLQEGIRIAIAGRPNAGKSSLLNALSGKESAIVTDIPGTTRDTLRELIDLDGIPAHIIDTAGLRTSDDPVEQEGIRRARQAIDQADLVMIVVDAQTLATGQDDLDRLFAETILPTTVLDSNRLLIVCNKVDLLPPQQLPEPLLQIAGHSVPGINVSAKQGSGIDELTAHLKQLVGYTASEEGSFTARQRQLEALNEAQAFLASASKQLAAGNLLELVAEDLRLAQQALGRITGQVTSDDLLGKIFASFCIGK